MASSTLSPALLRITYISNKELQWELDDGRIHTLATAAGRKDGHNSFIKWTTAFRILVEQGKYKQPRSRVTNTP